MRNRPSGWPGGWLAGWLAGKCEPEQGSGSECRTCRTRGKWDGKQVAHRHHMDLHAITSVRNDWAARSKGPAALAVFDRLVASEADLAALGADNLAELFSALARAPGSAPVAHFEVASALIRQFHADELVGVGLLAALVPGLVGVARSLS